MDWTRREFLVATGALASAAAIGPTLPAEPSPGLPHDGPAYLAGDPYRSALEEPGLGGRSFLEARDRALTWRMPARYRDQELLGLDLPHA